MNINTSILKKQITPPQKKLNMFVPYKRPLRSLSQRPIKMEEAINKPTIIVRTSMFLFQ